MRLKRYTVLKRFYGNWQTKFPKSYKSQNYLAYALLFCLRFGRIACRAAFLEYDLQTYAPRFGDSDFLTASKIRGD